MATKLIRNNSELLTLIAKHTRHGKTFDANTHLYGLSGLARAKEHGDTNAMARLVEGMPKSSRRLALIAWFKEAAPIKAVSTDKESGRITIKLKGGWKPEQFHIDRADATPFWAMTKERDPKPMTLDNLKDYLSKIVEGGTKMRPADAELQAYAANALKALA